MVTPRRLRKEFFDLHVGVCKTEIDRRHTVRKPIRAGRAPWQLGPKTRTSNRVRGGEMGANEGGAPTRMQFKDLNTAGSQWSTPGLPSLGSVGSNPRARSISQE